ncbi:MAG TPA: sugar phosphate isomerase/epimerase [Actinomycetes bacterium]|jgi:sugar phosphate isomerase/epimerase|nr:sugar phosphate isomerase/epimerase [Actinomycetes bacterium]
MKLGAYTACLHDKPVAEALQILRGLGLESAEINSGGFLPAPHLPIEQVRASRDARDEYLGLFEAAHVTLTALNCNGNPLDPNPEVGPRHAQDVRDAIELAALLGVERVVTMSGLPASEPGGRLPSWTVEPWHSVFLDARDYQWREVAIPYWKDIQARARDADVKVCIEMHPHNVVYNPATMERLATEVNATHVGAEMDPSHLFWQGIDPIAALDRLGGLVYNAAAKDTRINPAARVNGVLDDRFGRVEPDEPGAVSLGGRYTLSRWPENSSWDFVAVGRGHDVAFWSEFLQALHKIDPDMAVNIEHEDQELDQMEGLRRAAETLLEAAGRSR